MVESFMRNKAPKDLLLLFEILAVILLFLFNDIHIDKYIAILFCGLIFIIYVSNFILGRVSTGDNYIFLIVSMLLSIGIIMIYRIRPDLGVKQIMWALIGILLFYITYFAMRLIRKLENFGFIYYGISIFLFLLTAVLGTDKDMGAKNWIVVGNFSFQPTEMIKILVIFFIASYYSYLQYKLNKFKFKDYTLMGFMYILIGLMFIQRDLGTAAIFVSLFTGIQFVYDDNKKPFILNFLLMTLGFYIGYKLFSHVRVRVDVWLNPWTQENIYNKGRQIVQSLFAIGEGGFFGVGVGRGYPNLIPVGYSDAIFPIICEEMGIFTGIGIIMLFLLLAYRAIKISMEQEYKFYRILAMSVGILFTVQCFLNIGGFIKLIPMTGLTLPFVSYGGTSILSSFIALGILQVASEDMSYKYE